MSVEPSDRSARDTSPEPAERNQQYDRLDFLILAGLCLGALVLRLRVGINTTYVTHPDELYDYLEQAHRLAFGYGSDVWTYQHGMRSWVYPGILALLMKVVSWFDPPPSAYQNSAAAFMSIVSLLLVPCAYVLGRRAAGRLGAFFAAFVVSIWFELVYFAPKTLQEVIATVPLAIAACLCPDHLARRPGEGGRCWNSPTARLITIGVLLGLTVSFRIQLAPTVALIGCWLMWHDLKRTITIVAPAAILPVLAFGFLDWMTFRYPFQSFIMNVYFNLFSDQAHHWPPYPVLYLFTIQIHFIGSAIAMIVLLALAGAFRLPLTALIVVSVYAVHTAIGVKHYRYIYPAMPFLFTLAGIGTAILIEHLGRDRPAWKPAIIAVAVLAWGFTCFQAATDGQFRREWYRDSGMLQAGRLIAARPEVCRIGAYALTTGVFPGLAVIHHDVPVYEITRPGQFTDEAKSFNAALADDDNLPPETAGFRIAQCLSNGFNEASQNKRKPGICILVRPGDCTPGAAGNPGDRPPGW